MAVFKILQPAISTSKIAIKGANQGRQPGHNHGTSKDAIKGG
jgi:hypothetical protein